MYKTQSENEQSRASRLAIRDLVADGDAPQTAEQRRAVVLRRLNMLRDWDHRFIESLKEKNRANLHTEEIELLKVELKSLNIVVFGAEERSPKETRLDVPHHFMDAARQRLTPAMFGLLLDSANKKIRGLIS